MTYEYTASIKLVFGPVLRSTACNIIVRATLILNMHLRTFINVHICVYIHMYVYAFICINIHVYINIHLPFYVYGCIHTHINNEHVYAYLSIHNVYMCIYMYI
jgi:hypothetical protein